MPDKSLLGGNRGICFRVAPADVGMNRKSSSTSLCWKNLCQLFTCRQNQLVQINLTTLDCGKMSTAQVRIGLDLGHYICTSVPIHVKSRLNARSKCCHSIGSLLWCCRWGLRNGSIWTCAKEGYAQLNPYLFAVLYCMFQKEIQN